MVLISLFILFWRRHELRQLRYMRVLVPLLVCVFFPGAFYTFFFIKMFLGRHFSTPE